METYQNNEPHGEEENKERHNSNAINHDQGVKPEDIDYSNNNLAGTAAGNLPPEEKETAEGESAIKKDNEHGEDSEQRDPRGFVGDFAEPQHDD